LANDMNKVCVYEMIRVNCNRWLPDIKFRNIK